MDNTVINGHQAKKVYIYTLPKSGTYLLNTLTEAFGLESTGFHITENSYLDTGAHDAVTNRETPSTTVIRKKYIHVLGQMSRGTAAFGHLSPMFIPDRMLADNFLVIFSKRDPAEILTSEFNDFRFRRKDVAFVSRDTVADDKKAFSIYLEQHSPTIRNLINIFLATSRLFFHDRNYRAVIGDIAFMVDFRSLLDPVRNLSVYNKLCKFLSGQPVHSDTVAGILARDNKTKSASEAFDRAALWTKRNQSLYRELGFPSLARQLGYSGRVPPRNRE